jgi:rhodanese-related sulfurtransferase
MRTLVASLVVFTAAAACALPASEGAPLPPPASVSSETANAAGLAGVVPGVVDAETARALVAAGARVVDVRTPAEFAAGHLPGAVNVPYDELPRRHAELGPPSTPVLLYCRTGRRSAIAAETLRKNGFAQLYDLQAYDRWVAAERTPTAR